MRIIKPITSFNWYLSDVHVFASAEDEEDLDKDIYMIDFDPNIEYTPTGNEITLSTKDENLIKYFHKRMNDPKQHRKFKIIIKEVVEIEK